MAIAYGDTQRHKPNPEPRLLAASQMKINPEECVYVGDAISDFEAATSAGMKFVMYTEGETVAQTSVDSFEALPPLINSL